MRPLTPKSVSLPYGSGVMIRLISWNVAGRYGQLGEQVDYLSDREPDIVTLQEVTKSTLPLWKLGFRNIGLEFHADSFSAETYECAGSA